MALLFGGTGMITAYIAAGMSAAIPSGVLLTLFATLMLVVGAVMFFCKTPGEICVNPRSWVVVAATGAGVGVLTGFLGVGGGFLIVPALVMLVGLPIQQAVGTSLIIIAMNSFAGVLGHMNSTAIDLHIIGVFIISGFAGAFLGARLATIMPASKLRTSFAIFVVLLGAFLLVDNIVSMI